ncbi:MAG: YjcQ family protein [Clostridiales bacterium]|nr:YjcQ family protein [Clostridiales bacterium]
MKTRFEVTVFFFVQMAKDDYHVIVFRTLKYLYHQLKDGLPPEPEMLMPDSKIFEINEYYWKYVLRSMLEEDLIRGLTMNDDGSGPEQSSEMLKDIQITPKGIEYLNDNRMGQRVDQLINGVIKI